MVISVVFVVIRKVTVANWLLTTRYIRGLREAALLIRIFGRFAIHATREREQMICNARKAETIEQLLFTV